MKILVLNNLSIFSLFIAIVFRIINFKIKFLLIKQYFQNKRFLKEIGELPKLFAYPFGEASEEVFNIVKDSTFSITFFDLF